MENQKNKLTGVLDCETFGNDKRQYFVDIKKAQNQKHYLRITCRDQQNEDTFKRTQIIIFEDDLPFFVEAISMLLGRYSTGNLGISA